MPTILEALKIKDGNNTPADTITDFLREKRSTVLPYTDHTIASYISNGEDYNPIAPVVTNDNWGRLHGVLSDGSTRTYKVILTAMTSKYKDLDLHGIYYFLVKNSPTSLVYPEDGEEVYFTFTDANDVLYRVPGAYTRAGDGVKLNAFFDELVIPNRNKLSAYVMGHWSKVDKPVHLLAVCIPGETAEEITIKSFYWRRIKPL